MAQLGYSQWHTQYLVNMCNKLPAIYERYKELLEKIEEPKTKVFELLNYDHAIHVENILFKPWFGSFSTEVSKLLHYAGAVLDTHPTAPLKL